MVIQHRQRKLKSVIWGGYITSIHQRSYPEKTKDNLWEAEETRRVRKEVNREMRLTVTSLMMYTMLTILWLLVMMTMPMSDIQHKVIFTRLVLCDFASSHKKVVREMNSNQTNQHEPMLRHGMPNPYFDKSFYQQKICHMRGLLYTCCRFCLPMIDN